MNVKPLHDCVIIRCKEEQHLSAGGIVIPDAAAEKPSEGEVLATGNGKLMSNGKIVPLEVKTGDQVLYAKYAGTKIKVENEELLVMHESDIMAVLAD